MDDTTIDEDGFVLVEAPDFKYIKWEHITNAHLYTAWMKTSDIASDASKYIKQ